MTIAIDRAREVQQINSNASITNAAYIADDISSQTYKSLLGQRTSFIEFHRFMFKLSDIELQTLLKKHKDFVTVNYESMKNDRFLDVAMTRAAIDYQLVLREGMSCGIDLLEEIAKDWRSDAKLAGKADEITSDHLINFMRKL